jgi:hypothetical protein
MKKLFLIVSLFAFGGSQVDCSDQVAPDKKEDVVQEKDQLSLMQKCTKIFNSVNPEVKVTTCAVALIGIAVGIIYYIKPEDMSMHDYYIHSMTKGLPEK